MPRIANFPSFVLGAFLILSAAPVAGGTRACAVGPGDSVAVFERASPSVVSLEGTDGRGGRNFGTGLVWSAEGLVVTNRHVVQQMREMTATLHDGRRLPATALAVAPDSDVALVRVTDPGRLVPVALADDARPRVGEPVFAIGNPYGVGLSLSQGIVSGLDRTVDMGQSGRLSGAIQTDASLNPGNSGGALLDRRGCLLGMNSAILSPTGTSAGVGFALPARAVAETVSRLLSGESTPPPTLAPGTLGIIASFVGHGLLVEEVSGGSLAHRLGSRAGDIITHVNGVAVGGLSEVVRLVQESPVRSITVLRNGRPSELRRG
jgi:2-alkenal reductase